MDQHRKYIGKRVLIGLTYLDGDGELIEQVQLHGIIERIAADGIFIAQPNGEEFSLPPDLDSLKSAPPGKYRLRSTGEVVVDPDYLSSWTINKSSDEPSDSDSPA